MNRIQVLGFLGSAVLLSACSRPSSRAAPAPDFNAFLALQEAQGISLSPTPDCDAACTGLRNEFRYVVYAGKQIYCYWDEKKAESGTDFDALAADLERQIVTGISPSEYYLVLRRYASAFHDGHVNPAFNLDQTPYEVYTSPVRLELLAPATDHEKLIVSEVKDKSIGVAVGDEVLALSGTAAHDAITHAVDNFTSGSTERMRRYRAARLLVDAIGAKNGMSDLELQIRPLSGGATRQVSVYRSFEVQPKPTNQPGPEPTGTEYISARILPGAIGYLRLDGFLGTQDDTLLHQAMDRLAGTRGLILDIRKNVGGDLSGDRIIERLAEKTVIRYRRSERMSDTVIALMPEIFSYERDPSGLFALWHDLEVTPQPQRYDRPVVALISPHCFSACDTFSASLKDNRLATFVGEATGGGTGTPLVLTLPVTKLLFRYSVIRGQGPRGNLIEGSGTLPDVVVESTAEDRAKGVDRQLTRGLEILAEQIGQGGPGPQLDASPDGLAPVWEQGFTASPTRQESELTRRLSTRDGLD